MAKWNSRSEDMVTSFEGGKVYNHQFEAEWLNTLFTSLMSGKFYETEDKQSKRFIENSHKMIEKYGAKFVANCAVYARREIGVRSISTLLAAILNGYQFENKREFFLNFFNRADDVAELFACVDELGGKRSHGLINGTRDYVEQLVNEYAMGKYTLKNGKYNWFDIVNITHAKSKVVDKLKREGRVAVPETWETKISACHNQYEKNAAWKELIEGGKLGYMALVRNLRNILACDFCDDAYIKSTLVPYITDVNRIRGSLIMPYQIATTAFTLSAKPQMYYGEREYDFSNVNPRLLTALSDAFYTSVDNMPVFEGDKVAMVIDVSGSMKASISNNSVMSIKLASAVYATAFAIANPSVDIYKFGDKAKAYQLKKNKNIFKIMVELADNDDLGYGTCLGSVLDMMKQNQKYYDRMFVFSDCQVYDVKSWYNNSQVTSTQIKNYTNKAYCFDLASYGTSVLDDLDKDVMTINSLSDKIFALLPHIDDGYKGLIKVLSKLDMY